MSMKLIGLCGAAQAGKDTAASYLVQDGWTRIAFADALKAVLYDMDIQVEEGCRISACVDKYGWEWTKTNEPHSRGLLQRLGVAIRDHVDQDAWLNAAFRQMSNDGSYVVTDCRFPNELQAIKDWGGVLVHIHRPNHDNPAGDHISETAWQDAEFDWTVNNDLDPDYLGAVMRGIAMGL